MNQLWQQIKQFVDQINALTGHRLSAAAEPIPRYYIIQPGDTLWRLAKRFNTTVDDLVRANNIQNPNLIIVGQRLLIPTGQVEPEPEPPVPLPTPEPTPEPPPSEAYFEYEVQPGDTLWRLAQHFNTTVQKLVDINQLQDRNLIVVGQILLIPQRPETPPPTPEPTPEPPAPEPAPEPEPSPPASEHLKAIYLSYWGVRDAGLRSHALQLLEATELNAVVMDIKSDSGYLLFESFTTAALTDSEVAEALAAAELDDYDGPDLSRDQDLATAAAYNEVYNFDTMMTWLKKHGIYTIARIVVFKDNNLVERRPDLAIKDSRTDEPWRNDQGVAWTDPFLPQVWQYNANIAKQAADQGFDEIQYDYIRFPTDGPTEYAVYAEENTPESRQAALSSFLTLTREVLKDTGVKIAIDIFGYPCWRTYDPGIGQVIESLAPHLDVLCPMLYPSTFGAGLPGYPEYANAIAFPYEVVYLSTARAVERLQKINPNAVVRDWIQDFPDYRFDQRTYTPAEIHKQMRGAVEAGSQGWMLWDPRNRYTREALQPAQEPEPEPSPAPGPTIPTYPPNKMGQVLILEYHNIAEPEERWTRTPDNFRQDLEHLLAHGFYPVNLIDVVRGNLDHVPRGRRPVTLTFDDSSAGQFRYLDDGSIDPDCAAGILQAMHQKYGNDWPLRATFFVLLNADDPGTPLFHQKGLGPQKLQTLVEWGMEIGSHTINHRNLSQATEEEIKWELAVSQNRIEALVPGYQVRSFDPPFGAYPEDISLLKKGYSETANLSYRYECAVKVGAQPAPSPFSSSFDPYRIPRVQAYQPELDKWLPHIEKYPDRYYVSDGGQGDGAIAAMQVMATAAGSATPVSATSGAAYRVNPEPSPHLVGPDGNSFFILGVNYEGYFDRAWQMWEPDKFDLALIEKDFRKARQAGFNSLRLFVQSSLEKEIAAGNFDRLDWVLELAQRQKLAVLLALNDDHSANLTRNGDINAAIAAHYRGHPAVLGFDLENEPKLYHLLVAQYAAEHPAPLQSTVLIDHYGERVDRAGVEQMRQERRIPSALDDQMAYYYANGLQFFLDFNDAYNEWYRQTGQMVTDYISSPDATHWQTYIEVMNETVAAWIAPQLAPLRAADPAALVTVGWDWLLFAALAANQTLDFHQFHLYGTRSLGGLRALLTIMDSLQRRFPHIPLVVGEFGYSNATSSNPSRSQLVSQTATALYEGAMLAYLRANGFAGGMKWMLNDATGIDNPFEANLGVYAPGDQPKVVAQVIQNYANLWSHITETGDFTLGEDPIAELNYRHSLPGVSVIGGGRHQDLLLDWQASEGTHLYLAWADNITIKALAGGQISLNPPELIPAWAEHASILHRLDQGQRVRLAVFPAGERVVWTIQPNQTYVITRGAPKPQLPPAGEIPEPGPGEHVIILPDTQAHLDAARAYLNAFRPDVSFQPDEAAGRWPYVTIAGDTSGITVAQEEALRNAGAWVERVAADTLAGTKGLLDRLAASGYRFLQGAPEPSPEPPPTPEPPPEPPPPEPEPVTYTVQPGDTLWLISVKMYGTGSLWNTIFQANRDILDDPGRIRPGQVLKIPPQP
ncbi:MAG: LysM peptidoglycan-binding domain-containing protein [Anaerolineae bacterium]|nr:LysM peptidoglycan-binding domain-containing protein [Anaerolineae bacterium]